MNVIDEHDVFARALDALNFTSPNNLITTLAKEKLTRLRKENSRRFSPKSVFKFIPQAYGYMTIPATGIPVMSLIIGFDLKPIAGIRYSKSHFIFDTLNEL